MHALLVILLGLLLRAACLNGVVSVHGDVNELGCCLAPQRALLWLRNVRSATCAPGKSSTPVQKALRSTSVRRPVALSISFKKRLAAWSIAVAVFASVSSSAHLKPERQKRWRSTR